MTNAPETAALVPDEPSTSLTTSREHSVGIPMDPSITAVAKGQVEGAWSISALGDDWMPEKVFVLAEGEAMQVGKGSAIRVQSTDGWHHCEFPQPGVLHGPVVWTMAEATSEQDLLSDLDERPIATLAGTLGFLGGTVACASGLGFLVAHYLAPLGMFEENADLVGWVAGGALALSMVVGFPFGRMAASLTERVMDRRSPRTIASVNQRFTNTLRMPRSVFLALGTPQSHLKLVAPERPMDALDREIQGHLDSYRAQRAHLATKKIASGPLVEHTAAMIDEIESRLRGGTTALREDDLRRTYLGLVQRAEGDILKLLHKQEAKEAEGVARDMSALIQQMDRHEG